MLLLNLQYGVIYGGNVSGDYLNYFIGGIPPNATFEMHVEELEKLVRNNNLVNNTTGNVIPKVSFIGLVAYFEAFCRETAAAVINICPTLVHNLKKGNYSTEIDCVQLDSYGFNLNGRVGSILTESYDFGDGRKINAFFKCLFNRDAFSKDEIQGYGKILAERNLIVHNGGTYTTKFIKQHLPTKNIENNAFFHSLEFDHSDFQARLTFLRNISNKITRNAFDGIKVNDSNSKYDVSEAAVEALLWSIG